MSNTASRIIAKCGGPRQVATMLGIDVSWVYRWTYPRPKGTGGRVPAKYQDDLLRAAVAAGKDLSPADFFDLPDDMREAS